MSTYYSAEGVTSSHIAGAVALAALHDLAVNLFTFPGFPQVTVTHTVQTVFTITLSFGENNQISFDLTDKQAFATAKKFKKQPTQFDRDIFDVVQEALAKLEGAISSNKRLAEHNSIKQQEE